jgi:hypothetical protein
MKQNKGEMDETGGGVGRSRMEARDGWRMKQEEGKVKMKPEERKLKVKMGLMPK